MTPTRHLIVAAVFLYCLALYPAVLRYTQRTGYDAPIYWRAARGDLSLPPTAPNGHTTGWVYSDRLLPFIAPVAILPFPAFLLLLHTANSIGTAALMAAALRRFDAYPLLAGACAFVVGAKASDIVASGNVTGLLCGLALTPLGAVVAAAVKPQFVVALVLHAALWGSRQGRDVMAGGAPGRQLRAAGAVRRAGDERR